MNKNEILKMLAAGTSLEDIAAQLTATLNEAAAEYKAKNIKEEKVVVLEELFKVIHKYLSLCGIDDKLDLTHDDYMNMIDSFDTVVKDYKTMMKLVSDDDKVFEDFFKTFERVFG